MRYIIPDFETRSEVDLKKVGAWAYSEHPSTEVICLCWAIDEGPVHSFVPSKFSSPDLKNLLKDMPGQFWPGNNNVIPSILETSIVKGGIFEAHNVAFEYSIWMNICVKRWGWPEIPVENWRDTMGTSSYYALPASLDKLCRVLGLKGKEEAGKGLIQKYSKLFLKNAKRQIPPYDIARWVRYCAQDVEEQREVSLVLGQLPVEEEVNFVNDFKTNLRGLMLDEKGIRMAQTVVEKRAEELDHAFRELTGLGAGQTEAVRGWLKNHGLTLANLRAETIDTLLEDGEVDGQRVIISPLVRNALTLRRQSARASSRKLVAMLRQRDSVGRARFQTRYHGAATGRNTGSGFQPLNLHRGYDKMNPEQLVRDIGYGDPGWLDALYGDAMEAVGASVRYWIKAGDDSRLMAGDFASIEAVVLACLAGEEWKINQFRLKDPRVYEIAAERIYSLPPNTVTKETHPHERQDGKTCELAFGYRGALGAWRKFDKTQRHSDEAVLGFVKDWRGMHPNTFDLWERAEEYALAAVSKPGGAYGDNYFGFEIVDNWLTMILPDGKRIWYWHPQIKDAWPHWHDPENDEDCASGKCKCRKKPTLTYMAQKEGQWKRVRTYSGKLVENLVQATSRQILKPIERRIAKFGYNQVLSVYDEIVCEVPNKHGSLEEFKQLMVEPAGDWCKDWPIRAEVWEGGRYKK